MFFSSKMNTTAAGVTLIDDKNNINCDLWVGNVDSRVDEKVILEIFQNAGPIKNIRMPRVIDGHKGYCFVQFYHECSVPYSIQILEGTTLYGKKLKLQPRSGSFHSKAKKGEQLPDLIQQQVQLQQHQVHQQQQQIPQGQPLWYASSVPSTIHPNMVVYANPTLQYSNVSYPHGGIQAAAQLVNPYMTIPTTIQQQQQIQGAVRLQQPQGYFPAATIRAQQQSHNIPVQQPQPGGYIIQQPVMNQVIQVQNHPRPSNPSVLPSHHYVQTSNFPQQQIQSQFQQPQPQQLNNGVRGPRPRLQNSNNNGNRISFQQNNRALQGAQAALVTQQQQPQLFYNPMFTADGQQLSILQPGDASESQQQFFRQHSATQQQQPPAGTVILNGYQNPQLYHY